MGNPNPSPATRFPVNRRDHTQKHPAGYVKPILQKLFCAEWNIKDSQIKKLLKGLRLKETLGVALVLRKYLNGCEGNGKDIEDIFNRLDGKVPLAVEHSGQIQGFHIQVINYNGAGNKDNSSQGGVPASRLATEDTPKD